MPLQLRRGRVAGDASAVSPGATLHLALAAASLGWLGLVVTAPLAAQRGSWLGPLLYTAFDPLCHQIAERSFHAWGEPLAVCHRCLGLYAGFALGIVVWPFTPAAAARLRARPRWVLAFAAPLAIDATLLANTAATRFATGGVAAFPVAILALAAVAQIAASRARPLPVTRSPAQAAVAGATDTPIASPFVRRLTR